MVLAKPTHRSPEAAAALPLSLPPREHGNSRSVGLVGYSCELSLGRKSARSSARSPLTAPNLDYSKSFESALIFLMQPARHDTGDGERLPRPLPMNGKLIIARMKQSKLTSLPPCRETRRAEKNDRYFDFEPIKTHAHSDSHPSWIQATCYSHSLISGTYLFRILPQILSPLRLIYKMSFLLLHNRNTTFKLSLFRNLHKRSLLSCRTLLSYQSVTISSVSAMAS